MDRQFLELLRSILFFFFFHISSVVFRVFFGFILECTRTFLAFLLLVFYSLCKALLSDVTRVFLFFVIHSPFTPFYFVLTTLEL